MKRPQPKLPELKAPAFLADLYYDLRDRRLLPLIALVLVAIVATPILLGQSSETPPPVGAGAFAALREAGAGGSKLTVVKATPGLRDYRKRLRGRRPTDPFRQSKAKPDLSGARLGGGAEASSEGGSASSNATTKSTSTTVKETSTTKMTTESTTTNGSGEGISGAGNEGSGESSHGGTLYAWAADLTIVHSSGSEAEGNKQSDPPMKFEGVLGPTTLPSEKTQVVTYIGRSPKSHRAVFLVSPLVTGVFGEGKCAAGTGSCQLIELEAGFPEVFEYGEGTDRYTVKVTKLESVPDGHA
jgi:hypothetical protein